MSLLRAFIAVEIPLEIQRNIHRETAVFRKGIDSLVRWVPAENMHLTVKFLGDVSPSNVEFLIQMLRNEAENVHCFSIHLAGLGAYPSLKRPRVLYIGMQAPAGLDALQRGIEASSRRLGYESEERPFSPHLTLGRVKQDASNAERAALGGIIKTFPEAIFGTVYADAVQLIASDLQPTGPVYTTVARVTFKS